MWMNDPGLLSEDTDLQIKHFFLASHLSHWLQLVSLFYISSSLE